MLREFLESETNMELAKLFFLMVIVWMLYGVLSTTMLQPFVLVAGIAVSVVTGLKFYMYLYPPEERERRKEEKNNNDDREW